MKKCYSKSHGKRYLLFCALLLWTDLLIIETVNAKIEGFLLPFFKEKPSLKIIWHINLVGELKETTTNEWGFISHFHPSIPHSLFLLLWFAADKCPCWVSSLRDEHAPVWLLPCHKDVSVSEESAAGLRCRGATGTSGAICCSVRWVWLLWNVLFWSLGGTVTMTCISSVTKCIL